MKKEEQYRKRNKNVFKLTKKQNHGLDLSEDIQKIQTAKSFGAG